MDGIQQIIVPKPLEDLQVNRSSVRLQQVATLRALGLSEHINLPQLIVCGDQSAGKSSVLEGLTGIPFPRQDGLCTRFATEIILEHTGDDLSITATIIPGTSSSPSRKAELQRFRQDVHDFGHMPQTIADAGAAMGVKGFGQIDDGPAFAEDVLRIRISGPTNLDLTVVDLPGLISVPNDEQDDEDVETVHRIADAYVANPRTIILAVVQAGNDIANQPIIHKSRKSDKAGERTLGIITKPDLINKGTEHRIASLARNEDTTRLKLGFFILKNPTPKDLANGVTLEQRRADETSFFLGSSWKGLRLDPDRTGITSLRRFLPILLDQHLGNELPKVRKEIAALMRRLENGIADLGDERPTSSHLRMFLSRLATRFHGLTTAALNGNYQETDAVFFDAIDASARSARLRAVIHGLNTKFANRMRLDGKKRKVTTRAAGTIEYESPGEELEDHGSDTEGDEAPKELGKDDQILVSEKEMKSWVKEVYLNCRGKELPGNYNHVLLSELFHIQSSRWAMIASEHVSEVYEEVEGFVKAVLSHITKDEHVLLELHNKTELPLRRSKEAADQELRMLIQDEGQQPITYNHYYTDNVQQARQQTTRDMLRKAMTDARSEDWGGKLHVSNNQMDVERLLASLQKRIIVDMDEQACTEALAGLHAYYKASLKTFVDNVCRQVIERHLLRLLPTIFCPEKIAAYESDELEQVAGERPESVEKRKQLRELHEKLSASLQELRR